MASIIFARHAQHVVLVHFPIALFLTAVAFDCYAQWAKDPGIAAAAYLNLLFAAVTTIPVLATGLAAWAWALEGQRLKGTLLMHLVLGTASSASICLTCWIHWHARRHPANALPAYRFPLEAIGVLLVALTGHLGGILSGVNAG